MISTLKVKNFALISHLELSLNSGFTVITGETGSGKSILLGALELLLGDRADFSLIGKQGDKAIVEAVTQISSYQLQSFFVENDLEYEDETIIRREITGNGRSRAFINDSPVQLTVLRDLTSRLVNIHSQYNTLELRDKNYQLEILDILGGLESNRISISQSFSNFKKIELELREKENFLDEIKKQSDYIQFQLEEIEQLNLSKTNFEAIEAELNKAENAEQITRVLSMIEHAITGDGASLDVFSKAKNDLEKLSSIDEDLNDFSQRTNALFLELKELASDVSSYAERLEINPAQKDFMLVQIDNFNRILRKHNLKNQEELVALQFEFLNSAQQTEDLELEIENLKSNYSESRAELLQNADQLHQKRVENTKKVESDITNLLSELKLENTSLTFDLSKREECNATGISDLVIRFSANKGIESVPIEKAASGGELSRVMLALQKLISDKKALPTVLFDEIDTGVSGDVAQKMGNLLRRMGESRQLIAITHLPQVAAKSQAHFKVEKFEQNGSTESIVRKLNQEESIEEVARLMSGEVISKSALETAKSLING